MLTNDDARRAAQLAFLASGTELEVGRAEASPVPVEELERVDASSPLVEKAFTGGLTAQVFRLRAAGRRWTLKRARVPCLVKNPDGQSSFLNELQRRADFERLKAEPGGRERFAAVVDTVYGSLRRGILLSPWIEGGPWATWDATSLRQLFDLQLELVLAGLFEWDFCPGNVIGDGRRVSIFDFGYMYRFDPLAEPSSAGWGAPHFHPVERFETRNFFAQLLRREREAGAAAALAAFREEKAIALDAYDRLRSRLAERGATPGVLGWLDTLRARWREALAEGGDALRGLYLAEGWRSHRLDVHDDLSGQTCTPVTLERLAWLRKTLRERGSALAAAGALLGLDAGLPPAELEAKLRDEERLAARWQLRRLA